MTELQTAGPVPDAKSAAAPAGAAHSYPSTEDEEETSRPASQTSGSRCVPALAMMKNAETGMHLACMATACHVNCVRP